MHRKGVMPDDAIKYLIERATGQKVMARPDGSISIGGIRFKA
jgi:hypothetical protein